MMMTATDVSFAYETYVRTTPDQVWRAITDGEVTRQYFFGSPVESTWRVGAPVAFLTPDGAGHVAEGTVLEVEPPRRLVYESRLLYDAELAKDRAIRLTWEIEPLGEVCRVRIIHDRFEGETASYHAIVNGVPALMASIKSLLETGQPLPLPAPG